MRTVIVVLILLNAALGAMGRPHPYPGDSMFSCCRGTGVDAYCCVGCCYYPNCDSDLDCI